MDLHIPIWLLRAILALFLMIGLGILFSKYQNHPKAKYAVFAAALFVIWAGCYWLVSLI